jgi:hypothetical protein
MAGKVTSTLDDVRLIYKYVRKIGLILVCLILAGGWATTYFTTLRATDRWTGTDQRNYEKRHIAEVAEIVSEEKRIQARINNELLEEVQGIREEMAGDRVRLKNIDKTLDRIEKKVFNGNYRKGGG